MMCMGETRVGIGGGGDRASGWRGMEGGEAVDAEWKRGTGGGGALTGGAEMGVVAERRGERRGLWPLGTEGE